MPYPDNHPFARWLGKNFALKLSDKVNHGLCRFIRKHFNWALSPELFCILTKEWNKQLRVNLVTPVTFNDKLNYLMLHYRNPILVQLADKYACRSYVTECIGEEFLPKLLGVWESPAQIDIDELPDRFVLKANHGCGMNVICTDKKTLDWDKARRKLAKWLRTDISETRNEWQYHDIPRRIIAEEFLEDKGFVIPRDFKFLCCGGKVRAIMLFSDRGIHTTRMHVYTPEWERRPDVSINYPRSVDAPSTPRPDNLDKMIYLAEKLSKPFPLVRVDFYNLGGSRIVFGELTFSYGSGRAIITPRSFDMELGSYIDLDSPLCMQFLK